MKETWGGLERGFGTHLKDILRLDFELRKVAEEQAERDETSNLFTVISFKALAGHPRAAALAEQEPRREVKTTPQRHQGKLFWMKG